MIRSRRLNPQAIGAQNAGFLARDVVNVDRPAMGWNLPPYGYAMNAQPPRLAGLADVVASVPTWVLVAAAVGGGWWLLKKRRKR